MIPKFVNGLPLHPLVIHITVVLLPLAALAVLLAGVWPRARRAFNVAPLVLAVLAFAVYELSMKTGTNLKEAIGINPLIERHEQLAHQLIVPVLGLVVAAVLVEVVRQQGRSDRRPARADSGSTVLVVIAAVLAVGFASWTTVQTVRVGEAGARAVWSHTVSS